MRPCLAWLLSCAIVFFSTTSGDAADETAALDSLVTAAMKFWNVPGVAVAVVRDGEVVYLKGHGFRDIAAGQAVTPDTIFPLASCTKNITTAALAILVDEGKLAWDDPVRKHVSFFHLSDPLADKDVRIRDLLCHRTGVGSHDLLWYRAPWSPEESVRRVAFVPLDRPFRTAFQYQSTMFTAAGFAVRSASGKPWEDFVRSRLLEPLGMRSTYLTSTAAAESSNRSTGYEIGERNEPVVVPPYPLAMPDAAGSAYSTARDLARWLQFQLALGKAGDRRLVSEASLQETHRPQMVIPMGDIDRLVHCETVQMSYGMGWVIQDYRGRRLVSHAGIIDGFRCHLTIAPDDKVGIVILANLHRTRLNQALSNAILDHLLQLPVKGWNRILAAVVHREALDLEREMQARAAARHPNTQPSLPLAGYVGAYEHPAFGATHIALEGGRLVWSFNSFQGALEHYQYDTFVLPLNVFGRPLVRFTPGSTGTAIAVHIGGKLDVEFRRGNRSEK